MSIRASQGVRLIRAASWTVMGLAFFWRIAVLLLGWSDVAQMVAGDVVSYVFPLGLSLVLLGIVTFRTLGQGLEHRFWGLLWLSIAPVFVAEVYWTYYALVIDARGPIDSLFVRALHVVGQAFLLLLLVRMTRFGGLPAMDRVRFHIDIVSVLAVAWPVVYLAWTLPAFGDLPGGGAGVAAIAAVYPLFGVLMIVAITPILLAPRGIRKPWERIAATALIIYGCQLVLNPYLNVLALQGDAAGFAVLTAISGLSLLMIDVAVVYRLTEPETDASVEPWSLPEIADPKVLRMFPVVVAIALVPMGVLAIASADTPMAVPLQRASVLVATLLALRSFIAAVERARARAVAAIDPETGALDRRLLAPRLAERIDRAGEAGHPLSLVVYDVSEFRWLSGLGGESELPGHGVVTSMHEQASGPIEVFRVGDDRFACILDGYTPADAASFALRVWLASSRESPSERVDLRSGMGAGVASFPLHALSADALLAAAELAVAVARGSESEPVAVYDATAEMLPADERHARERMRILRSTVRALAEAVYARDPATRDHSANVAELATALAQVLGLADSRVQIVGLGALMHDVGKIGVRDEILLKPGPLDPAERAEVEEHPVLGEQILSPTLLDDILPIVRWHHERWDGQGYPDRLAGEDIPVEARALAICDAFETLTTGRPYREAVSLEAALAEIEACAGGQFDPVMTAAFARMVRGLSGPHAATAAS